MRWQGMAALGGGHPVEAMEADEMELWQTENTDTTEEVPLILVPPSAAEPVPADELMVIVPDSTPVAHAIVAERTNFMPPDVRRRATTLSWLQQGSSKVIRGLLLHLCVAARVEPREDRSSVRYNDLRPGGMYVIRSLHPRPYGH